MCAACVGSYFKVNETDINSALESYVPEMNRSQVKKTNNNTVILDAYNANPSSMFLAIDNFKKNDIENKILILGDMFELGEYSKEEHYKILSQIENSSFQEVYLIGIHFFELKDEFLKYHFFKTTQDLISHLNVSKLMNYTVLIKGSRGMKLEKVVDSL